MYPRSTSYLAQTPESEADLADGLGIVNKHGPQLNMVTFNPTPEDTKELELQKGQPGVRTSLLYTTYHNCTTFTELLHIGLNNTHISI